MNSDRHKDSGEMYSPDKQGEYTPLDGTLRFSVQGLSDALADVREGINETPAEEYTMMLEMMMALASSSHILLECGNGNAHIEE